MKFAQKIEDVEILQKNVAINELPLEYVTECSLFKGKKCDVQFNFQPSSDIFYIIGLKAYIVENL